MLFIAPAPGPMSTWPVTDLPPLGSIEFVIRRIGEVFPDASWRQLADTWFGRATADGIEFQVAAGEDGVCRHLTVRRVSRDEVEALCRALGLVAVDPRFDLIRP